jgi:hypothetical protein
MKDDTRNKETRVLHLSVFFRGYVLKYFVRLTYCIPHTCVTRPHQALKADILALAGARHSGAICFPTYRLTRADLRMMVIAVLLCFDVSFLFVRKFRAHVHV